MNLKYPEITLSVVSHNQSGLVSKLLVDLEQTGAAKYLKEVIITCNVAEDQEFHLESTPIRVINNNVAKGFGANHNAAFSNISGKYFCVANPDIRLNENPFPELLKALESSHAAIVVPYVYALDKTRDDSIRYFPTVPNLFRRLLNISDGRYPASSERIPYDIEWAAGMFMLFKASDFKKIGGFDEKFFLYYEDVDICLRMWQAGLHVVACPQAAVIHEAQRASHKSLRYLRWHINSLIRYFLKHGLRQPKITVNESSGG